MKHPRIHYSLEGNFNAQMTPMIDVIFQLLIFFLCTAGFDMPEAVLRTELPPTGAVAPVPPKPRDDLEIVRIQLSTQGEKVFLQLNDRPLSGMSELLDQLARLAGVTPDAPVILESDPDVPIGNVIEVYDGCLSRGLKNVHFAAGA